MLQSEGTIYYDVAIIGAGPAGCSCALTLKDAGLRVLLLDKASFPRDKICGDAIPGRAVKILRNIAPQFESAFKQFPGKLITKKTTLYYKGKELTFDWVQEAYTCTRMEFDNFLFDLVKENTNTDVLLNSKADRIIYNEDSISITLKGTNVTISTNILIGADGAQSVVAKQLTNKILDKNHYVGSVRAYYHNIAECDTDTTHIYFDKKFLPSYLWVFPLPGNKANVGFGMLSSEIASKKADIKKIFYEFIGFDPVLKRKFVNANPVSELQGFGLPLGSKTGTLSGKRFMIIGDAASLIDPISGDGIGNAMISGKLAAEQAISCFRNKNFTADFIGRYDASVLRAIGKELKKHYHVQQILFKMPFLLDMIFFAGRSKFFKPLIQKAL